MPRDDFTVDTKRKLMYRAGGRCSFPSCDILCWVPGTEVNKVYTIGVAAHIKAASVNGPRYDKKQSISERKDISNAIYLCQNHAHEIDQDVDRFSSDELLKYKQKHEEQIQGESSGNFIFPEFKIRKLNGKIVTANKPQIIRQTDKYSTTEYIIVIKNISDFKYERIGFVLFFPEFIKDPIKCDMPPGFKYKIVYSLKDWEVNSTGTASALIPTIKYHDFIDFEGTSLLQGQEIELHIITKKAPIPNVSNNKVAFHFCGGISILNGTILKEEKFTIPIFYDEVTKEVTLGTIHKTDITSDRYITSRRMYIL